MSKKIPYPYCFVVRDYESLEALWFIKIENEAEDIEFPEEVFEYVKNNFKYEKVTFAEAESYELFGVANICSPKQFAKWLVGYIDKKMNFSKLSPQAISLSAAKTFPSYQMIKMTDAVIGVVRINSKSEDYISDKWREKFNESFERKEISDSEFHRCVSYRVAPELNMEELIHLIEDL